MHQGKLLEPGQTWRNSRASGDTSSTTTTRHLSRPTKTKHPKARDPRRQIPPGHQIHMLCIPLDYAKQRRTENPHAQTVLPQQMRQIWAPDLRFGDVLALARMAKRARRNGVREENREGGQIEDHREEKAKAKLVAQRNEAFPWLKAAYGGAWRITSEDKASGRSLRRKENEIIHLEIPKKHYKELEKAYEEGKAGTEEVAKD
ncbi:hypothetical protein M405DRAFT_840422 [Rhizopogon salebrosus TDB-379]|nr:hypothetical protein M405DRAFT_840422 [Rhizopogon salebrosus TDB-379]